MGVLKHRRPVLAPNVTQLQTDVTAAESDIDQLQTDVTDAEADITQLQTDVSSLETTAQEYIAIKHSSAGDDLTVTGSNASYIWTGVNFQSTPANFTLNANQEDLLFNIGGKFAIDWHLLFGSSGGTAVPYWIFCFLEVDEGTQGSWSQITGTVCAASITTDPGGGQAKLHLHSKVITSVAAGDSIRIRVRRIGAATTVTSDGSNGGNLNVTKLDD